MFFDAHAALLYVALRTSLAALFALRLLRAGGDGATLIGQAAADGAAVLFVLGAARADLRAAVGLWYLPMLLYAGLWELRRFWLYLDDAMEPLAGESPNGVTGEPVVSWAAGSAFWAWQALAVAPALAAGLMVAFDAVAPGVWVFPTN